MRGVNLLRTVTIGIVATRRISPIVCAAIFCRTGIAAAGHTTAILIVSLTIAAIPVGIAACGVIRRAGIAGLIRLRRRFRRAVGVLIRGILRCCYRGSRFFILGISVAGAKPHCKSRRQHDRTTPYNQLHSNLLPFLFFSGFFLADRG